MARVVRKVSNKAVQNQKKNNILHNKIFWIIISVVLVIGVAVGIVLGIVLNQDKEEEVSHNYFNEYQEVTFEQGSYYGILNYSDPDYKNIQTNESLYIKHILIFGYDSKYFYPDSEDTDNYNSNHETLLKRLADLQKSIDEYNKTADKEDKAALFIVDTNVGSNSEILSDSDLLGSLTSDELSFFFSYIRDSKLVDDKLTINDIKTSFLVNDVNEMLTTTIPQSISLVKNNFECEEK